MPAKRKHNYPFGGAKIRAAEGVCFSFHLEPSSMSVRSSSSGSNSDSSSISSSESNVVPTSFGSKNSPGKITTRIVDEDGTKLLYTESGLSYDDNTSNPSSDEPHAWDISSYLFPSLTASRVIKSRYSAIFADWSRLHPDESTLRQSTRKAPYSNSSPIPSSAKKNKFGFSSGNKRETGSPVSKVNGSPNDFANSRSSSLPGRGTRHSSRRTFEAGYYRNYINVSDESLDDTIDVVDINSTPRSRTYAVQERQANIESAKRQNSTFKPKAETPVQGQRKRFLNIPEPPSEQVYEEYDEDGKLVDGSTLQKRLIRESKIHRPTRLAGQCASCKTSKTGQWRRGPLGPRTLCNACGLEWSKKEKSRLRALSDGVDPDTIKSEPMSRKQSRSNMEKAPIRLPSPQNSPSPIIKTSTIPEDKPIDVVTVDEAYKQSSLEIPNGTVVSNTNRKASISSQAPTSAGSSIGEKDAATPSPTEKHAPRDIEYKNIIEDVTSAKSSSNASQLEARKEVV